MSKGLLIQFLAVILLLANSAALLGNDFGVAGYWTKYGYDLKVESYLYEPIALFLDIHEYDNEERGVSYNAVILGVEYFPFPFTDHDGLFIGVGYPVHREIDYETGAYSKLKDVMGPAFESGMEFRGGFRYRPISDLPSFFMEIEYSNIKEFSANVGITF